MNFLTSISTSITSYLSGSPANASAAAIPEGEPWEERLEKEASEVINRATLTHCGTYSKPFVLEENEKSEATIVKAFELATCNSNSSYWALKRVAPILSTAISGETRSAIGPKVGLHRIQQLDGVAIRILIDSNIDVVGVNPRKKRAVITNFERLLLGVKIEKRVGVWRSDHPVEAPNRLVDSVVAIATMCIEASGCFNRKAIDQVIAFRNANMQPKEGSYSMSEMTENASRIFKQEVTKRNPHFRLLNHTPLKVYASDDCTFTAAMKSEVAEAATRLYNHVEAIEPHLDELQQTQTNAYNAKFDWMHQMTWAPAESHFHHVSQIGGNRSHYPKEIVKIILQYALRYTPEDETAVIPAAHKYVGFDESTITKGKDKDTETVVIE